MAQRRAGRSATQRENRRAAPGFMPWPTVPAGGRGCGAPDTALPGPEATAGRGELALVDFAYLYFPVFRSEIIYIYGCRKRSRVIFCYDERFCFTHKKFCKLFFSCGNCCTLPFLNKSEPVMRIFSLMRIRIRLQGSGSRFEK